MKCMDEPMHKNAYYSFYLHLTHTTDTEYLGLSRVCSFVGGGDGGGSGDGGFGIEMDGVVRCIALFGHG